MGPILSRAIQRPHVLNKVPWVLTWSARFCLRCVQEYLRMLLVLGFHRSVKHLPYHLAVVYWIKLLSFERNADCINRSIVHSCQQNKE